ncbi:MAG: hypothetical protein ACRDDZ_06280 [Marinifilaceae bacterium]
MDRVSQDKLASPQENSQMDIRELHNRLVRDYRKLLSVHKKASAGRLMIQRAFEVVNISDAEKYDLKRTLNKDIDKRFNPQEIELLNSLILFPFK